MKVTNITRRQTLNTPVQQMKDKSLLQAQILSQHKHTSGNSAVLSSDKMVCVLYIFNHFHF